MSAWGMDDGAALPVKADPSSTVADETKTRDPQQAGWAKPQAYDYAAYNRTSDELRKDSSEGICREWASNSTRYEWSDEYGDVGPAIPELERELFGSEERVRTGIQFDKISEISVTQEGTFHINPIRSFEDAGLHPVMLENVKLAGYKNPTPVQSYTLPAIFKGHDVVACAQTGSGKTAAYFIPTLSKLMGKAKKLAARRPNPATFRPGIDQPVRAEPLLLVVCPSRELATQIFDEARRFCYRSMLRPCVLYGGGPVSEQLAQIQKGCDVLISTPGRLCDFIERPHALTLHRLKYMIIDEADEMLNADWETELKKIMAGGDQDTGDITYMMFSATFPKAARELAKEHLAHDHVRIRVGRAGSSHENIKQTVVYVEQSMKRQALLDLLFANPPARTIVFVNSKRSADELDDYLFNLKLPCTSIHSDRTQREREDALRAFRNGTTPILVATGVSARGLDIRNVMHIINYDLPSVQYGGIEEYIHRIGRTGRIGNMGLSTSFYNDRNEELAQVLTKILIETHQDVPDFLQQYMPEDTTDLQFEEESGDENENGEATNDNDAGGWDAPAVEMPDGNESGGWDAPVEKTAAKASSGWDAPVVQKPVTEVSSGWDAPVVQKPVTQASSGWDAPVVQKPVTEASSGRNAPVVQKTTAKTSSGWGAAIAEKPAKVSNGYASAAKDSKGTPKAPPATVDIPNAEESPDYNDGWGTAQATDYSSW